MASRALPIIRPVAPPLIHLGERERLAEERVELLQDLQRLPANSRLRPGLEYRLVKVTSRLLVFEPVRDVPVRPRADLE
ncbi:MAG: hypothetical protein ACRDBL_09165 [Rhabdaerophilum sp.]